MRPAAATGRSSSRRGVPSSAGPPREYGAIRAVNGVARRVRRGAAAASGRAAPADAGPLREMMPVALLAGVVLVVLAALAVLPARTWWTQREVMADTQAELDRMEGEVEALRAELELLRSDAEIERQARENFDLVYPGEESYRIVPDDGEP